MKSNDSQTNHIRQSSRLGVVSFLNSRPLICGLEKESAVKLCFDVPSRLTERMIRGEFDAALVPVIDLLREDVDLQVISSSCIGCDGETLTVRVFSRVPPEKISRIYLDIDSHTSATLVRMIWPQLYRREVEFVDLSESFSPGDCDTVLLIGDKVVSVDPDEFRYQIDLGGAWKTWTGLPFVFAVWAAPGGRDFGELSKLLDEARGRGVKQAGQLAVEFGPVLGWPAVLAQQYLQRYLTFGLTDKHVEGMVRFLDLAKAQNLTHQNHDLQAPS